jgi:hypothetical protein
VYDKEHKMNSTPDLTHTASHYELRFRSLFGAGRSYGFPCDESGLVDLDALSASALDSYLYARAVIGCEVAWPAVQLVPEWSPR